MQTGAKLMVTMQAVRPCWAADYLNVVLGSGRGLKLSGLVWHYFNHLSRLFDISVKVVRVCRAFYKNRARELSIMNFMEIDLNPHNPHCLSKDTSANYLWVAPFRPPSHFSGLRTMPFKDKKYASSAEPPT